jgi:succinoglycan biosynthesis protein ExoA
MNDQSPAVRSLSENHERVRRISIIAPMLNEAEHVDQFIADVAQQDYEGELEILVADGGSSDGSVEKIRTSGKNANLTLTVLENPARWVAPALNACIRRATGDLIVRLDCHSRYPSDYLRRCAIAAEETGADVVGGIIVARGRTSFEHAVACAMDTAFGGIGFYRTFPADRKIRGRLAAALRIPSSVNGGGGRVECDTVTFGAFRPHAFRQAGLFDEGLQRNQDDEFNLRLRRHGGRIVLDPSIHVHYTPRGSFGAVFRQYYEYGLWKVPVMLQHRELPSARRLAPLAFTVSLPVLAIAGMRFVQARQTLAAELALYGCLAFAAAAVTANRRGESWALMPKIAAVFPAFHLGYGVGLLRGLARAALRS